MPALPMLSSPLSHQVPTDYAFVDWSDPKPRRPSMARAERRLSWIARLRSEVAIRSPTFGTSRLLSGDLLLFRLGKRPRGMFGIAVGPVRPRTVDVLTGGCAPMHHVRYWQHPQEVSNNSLPAAPASGVSSGRQHPSRAAFASLLEAASLGEAPSDRPQSRIWIHPQVAIHGFVGRVPRRSARGRCRRSLPSAPGAGSPNHRASHPGCS
jgi:hypothetical protein